MHYELTLVFLHPRPLDQTTVKCLHLGKGFARVGYPTTTTTTTTPQHRDTAPKCNSRGWCVCALPPLQVSHTHEVTGGGCWVAFEVSPSRKANLLHVRKRHLIKRVQSLDLGLEALLPSCNFPHCCVQALTSRDQDSWSCLLTQEFYSKRATGD